MAAASPNTQPRWSNKPGSRSSQPQPQPPSHRNPEYRRSQLLRQYTSLLRTTPLLVLFQHNNLRSTEWTAIRRELNKEMQKLDEQLAADGRVLPPLAPHVKFQIVQTSIFEVAIRIVEFFRPEKNMEHDLAYAGPLSPAELSARLGPLDPSLTHDLSRAVHDAVLDAKGKHELSTLLVGPIAVLSMPIVSPEHMKAALSILAPKELGYPAPTRRANPDWHDPLVQIGLQKLNPLAARIDGKVFDVPETKLVGSIEGGMDGLRVQLVRALESIGASITNTLEGTSKSLYLTLEGHKSELEEKKTSTEHI